MVLKFIKEVEKLVGKINKTYTTSELKLDEREIYLGENLIDDICLKYHSFNASFIAEVSNIIYQYIADNNLPWVFSAGNTYVGFGLRIPASPVRKQLTKTIRNVISYLNIDYAEDFRLSSVTRARNNILLSLDSFDNYYSYFLKVTFYVEYLDWKNHTVEVPKLLKQTLEEHRVSIHSLSVVDSNTITVNILINTVENY